MIDEIEVQNLALIRDASIAPSPRMTVITGETGAGKTALLAACRLMMGQRADKGMVREGTGSAQVEGRIYLAPAQGGAIGEDACSIIAASGAAESENASVRSAVSADSVAGADSADSADSADIAANTDIAELVVSRSLSADGRSRVKINGHMASVAELAELVGPSISLCSQHDQVTLMKPSMHRVFLDRWAQISSSAELASYRSAFHRERECRSRLERLEADAQASDSRLEEARFRVRQIGAVEPSVDDYEALLCDLRKSENAELLARTSAGAHAALSGDGGALDSLNQAMALLDEGSIADAELARLADSIRDALYSIEDAARDAGSYVSSLEFDGAGVEAMQERVAAYQSLMRSFGPTVADVVSAYDEARSIVAADAGSGEALAQARDELDKAILALEGAALRLHEVRASAAPRFSSEMNSILADLGMGSSSLSCDVIMEQRSSWGADGPDAVRFMFTPAAGMQPRPLSKIASGGELGRVMLALHVAMGNRDAISTLVFDEIDSGVGGSVASAIGNMMARLSETHQVIAVTHSAQMAACADRHFVASKVVDVSGTETTIAQVEGQKRVEEIARMLSGALTDASLAHARELLICKNAANAG